MSGREAPAEPAALTTISMSRYGRRHNQLLTLPAATFVPTDTDAEAG